MENISLQSYKVQCLTKTELKTMNQILKSPLRTTSLVVVHYILFYLLLFYSILSILQYNVIADFNNIAIWHSKIIMALILITPFCYENIMVSCYESIMVLMAITLLWLYYVLWWILITLLYESMAHSCWSS